MRLDNPHRNGPPEPDPATAHRQACLVAQTIQSAIDELDAATQLDNGRFDGVTATLTHARTHLELALEFAESDRDLLRARVERGAA